MVDNADSHTASESIMVPIGLQLMLCPSKDEGHIHQSLFIPPSQLPEGAVRCGTRAAKKLHRARFLNPLREQQPCSGL